MTSPTTPTDLDLTQFSDPDLAALADAVEAEQARRSGESPLRVALEFDGCNPRRYSRPWIAVVTDWPVGGRATLEWGEFLGRNGDAGEVEILARPGDVVRWGQKDRRRPDKSESHWGIVEADASVREVDEPEARRHWAGR